VSTVHILINVFRTVPCCSVFAAIPEEFRAVPRCFVFRTVPCCSMFRAVPSRRARFSFASLYFNVAGFEVSRWRKKRRRKRTITFCR
ncbi:Hypothetical predicted protein, partial [Paramuricea clavata]